MDKFLRIFVEVLGWLVITLSGTILGGFLMIILTFTTNSEFGFKLGLCFIPAGLILGAIWATRMWRKHGTVWFLSRLIAHPELDERYKAERKKEKFNNE